MGGLVLAGLPGLLTGLVTALVMGLLVLMTGSVGFGIPLERCPSVGILQLTADPDDYIDTIGQARFFIGTTLMPLDTLRTGIEEGHFRLIDARPDLIFAPRTIDIWRECMRLLPGTAPLWSTHTPYGEN